ncbi:hypothetical protein [Sporolactobacillus putidus]|uniref:Uncharacterized protein n=1 Tax=Sporolactobacillus putidus TaxID=492735 RepID=A0A917W116_9BACL|nr:hypothetical protein [Sporolactobacillus putidus]GGL55770.1 hypothetical protein GCM10007968_19830 [Sporolactobacillus putidus]
MYDDRDKDVRNYRKAIYYDGIHRYENGEREKSLSELTLREFDHICYGACYSANKQLLSAIMPRLKEIEEKESTLFKMIDNLLEDNREIYKQLEGVKAKLTGGIEKR